MTFYNLFCNSPENYGCTVCCNKTVCCFFFKTWDPSCLVAGLSAKQNQMCRYGEKVYFHKHEDFGYECSLGAIWLVPVYRQPQAMMQIRGGTMATKDRQQETGLFLLFQAAVITQQLVCVFTRPRRVNKIRACFVLEGFEKTPQKKQKYLCDLWF